MLSVYGVIFHIFQDILTKNNWLRLRWLRQRQAEAEVEITHFRFEGDGLPSLEVTTFSLTTSSLGSLLHPQQPHPIQLKNSDGQLSPLTSCLSYMVTLPPLLPRGA